MESGKCRSCGAEVIWIKTNEGKPHPCDPGKKSIITEQGVYAVGFESHFATCPHAITWRKKKVKK